MGRIRRRPPTERHQRAAPEDRGSREKLLVQLGYPPGSDLRTSGPDDPDVIAFRAAIGWQRPAAWGAPIRAQDRAGARTREEA